MKNQQELKILNELYAKDEQYVYYCVSGYFITEKKWEPIKDSDPKTFEILSKSEGKDRNFIYVHGKINKEIDRNSYEKIDSEGMFFKDKNHVYQNGFIVSDINPESVKILTKSSHPLFIKDNKHGYFDCGSITQIQGSDGASFNILSEMCLYSYDKNYVYFEENKIPNSDPKTIQVIKNKNRKYTPTGWIYDYINYAKDKNYVYYRGKLIDKADVDSFKVLKEEYACDKKSFGHKEDNNLHKSCYCIFYCCRSDIWILFLDIP